MAIKTSGSLGDRLKKIRHQQIQQHFVGREQERALFKNAITADIPPFVVLHIHGPGGIGKTALLQAFCVQCETEKISYAYINANTIEIGNRNDFAKKILDAAHMARVIMIDTYELLSALDHWFRIEILPQLPEDALVVIAGRNPPSQQWMDDLGLGPLTHVILLSNLNITLSEAFFAARGIPANNYQSALTFANGHPLAMSLIADLLNHNPSINFNPNESPDLIRMLISRFIEDAPTDDHRRALELCALLRVSTEQSLSQILKKEDINLIFDWLRGLSFIESGLDGLYPQSMARDALIADLKWRNPTWYLTLKQRAFTYLEGIVFGKTKHKVVEEHDLLFLFRDHPEISPYFMWDSALWNEVIEHADPSSYDQLLTMVETHEGVESAKWAKYWFQQQPQHVYIGRNLDNGEITGFVCIVHLNAQNLKEHVADPYMAQVAAYIKKSEAGLPRGRELMAVRFWMDTDAYQHPDNFQNVLFDWITHYYLANPDLAYTFTLRANPEFWKTYTDHSDFVCLHDHGFIVDNKPFALLLRNWLQLPPHQWLKNFYRKLLKETEQPNQTTDSTAYLVLNRPDFNEAVRNALRVMHDIAQMRHSPLIHARCVAAFVPANASISQRVKFLQGALNQAINKIKEQKDSRSYDALHLAFVAPDFTQDDAAKQLNISLSTFRRNLNSGIDEVCEMLWENGN